MQNHGEKVGVLKNEKSTELMFSALEVGMTRFDCFSLLSPLVGEKLATVAI